MVLFNYLFALCISLNQFPGPLIKSLHTTQYQSVTQKILLPDISLPDSGVGSPALSIACRLPLQSTAMLVMTNETRDTVGLFTIVVVDSAAPKGIRYMFNKSDWIIWKVFPSTYVGKGMRRVSLELVITSQSGSIWSGEFGTFRGKRPETILKSFSAPDPASLKMGNLTFNYRIDAEADVNIEVVPLNTQVSRSIFGDTKKDLPAGLRQYSWNLRDNSGKQVPPGEYYIRFRCKARNTLQEVNDICLPFKIVA